MVPPADVGCDCPLEDDDRDPDDMCRAEGPFGASCTRPEDHDGDHSACSVSDHPVAVWTHDYA